MVRPNHPAEGLSGAAWDRVGKLVEEFDAAWQSGSPPSIEDFLQRSDAGSPTLVVELVHSDLERRLKRGEPVRVEGYLNRFPQLAADRAGVVALLAAEFSLRQRGEPALTAREYEQRFPQYREDLTQRLRGPHRPNRHTNAVVACPQCHQNVAASDDAPTENVSCSSCGHTFRLDQSSVLSTEFELRQIDSFELLGAVGQGAFGTVYRAHDTALDRIVAVKVPRAGQWATAAELERFVREARSAAQLVHPGIVPVYKVGRESSLPYIVSAFVSGRTLAEEMREHPPDARAAANLVAQVAEALAYAHQHGVVHRDLKPSNVMLGRIEESRRIVQNDEEENKEDRRAFVMDFGLARRDEGESTVTVAGQILGTPAYMSPEQARGEGHEVDGRSDVYSAGVILYEMLTGELPFRGVARMVLQQILTEEPRPPRRLNDQVSRDLETIALKCLAKERGGRYDSAGHLAADLRRWLTGEPIQARPVGRWERSWRWARRNPRVATLSGMVAALLVTVVVGSVVAAALFNAEADKALRAQKDAERAQGDAQASQHKAEQSATFASQQLDFSMETLNKLVYEVQDYLTDKPALHDLRMTLLDTAIAGLKQVAENSDQRRTDVTMAKAQMSLADILNSIGKTAEARDHYHRSLASAEAILRDDPANRSGRQTLAMTSRRLGTLELNAGHSESARGFADRALAVTRAWIANESENANAHLYGASALNLSGRIQRFAGDVKTAADMFAKAADEARAAIAIDASDINVFRELRYAQSNAGDMALQTGALGEAKRLYEEAMRSADRELAFNPKSPHSRMTRAGILERLGDVFRALREYDEATKILTQCRDERAALSAADPQNYLDTRGLALAHGKLAEIAMTLKKFDEAREGFQKALDLVKALAEADPANAEAHRDWAHMLSRLGSAYSSLGLHSEAKMYLAQSIEESRRLAAQDPTNIQAQTDLAAGNFILVNTDLAARDFDDAMRRADAGMAILQRLEEGGQLKGRPYFSAWLQSGGHLQAVAHAAQAAVNNLDFALAQPDSVMFDLMPIRAGVLASLGRHDDAIASAEALRKRKPADAETLYGVACCYAEGVRACADTPADSTAAIASYRSKYLRAAMDALNEAAKYGFQNTRRLEADRNLDALRNEADFRAFVKRLQGKQNEKQAVSSKTKP